MTCIVGLIDKEAIYIGGDSAASSKVDVVIRKDAKVFVLGNKFIFGGAGSFRMIQVLNFGFKPPAIKKGKDTYEYMCTDFINELRKSFKDAGFLSVKNEREVGGPFIVGVNGRLFTIDSDFQVGESLEPYCSIGSGESYAMGTLYGLRKSNISPERKILQALEAAQHYTTNVRGPFIIKSISL